MDATRVLLADDHTLVRAGLRGLVDKLDGFCVVAEVGDGREAVRLTRQLAPEIVLMDISMPGLNGLDATALIMKEMLKTRVIILSMHLAESYVLEALRVGAVGYVAKDAAVHELERALRAVRNGDRWLSSVVSGYLMDNYLRHIHPSVAAPDAESSPNLLTPRQREVLQLIAEGHSTKQIAERLSISIKTVETHRAQLTERLHIYDVAGLTRFAIRTGLVNSER
ncbi:MAG: response regulator [Candidatus Competibacteraceae bacterium]|jgi:DNA-binding NarL/FixJ family response regulator